MIGYSWFSLCACREDGKPWILASLSKTILVLALNSRSWENEYSEFLTAWTSVLSCVDIFVHWVGTVGPQHSYNAQAPGNWALRSFIRIVLQWPSRSLWPCCSCAGVSTEGKGNYWDSACPGLRTGACARKWASAFFQEQLSLGNTAATMRDALREKEMEVILQGFYGRRLWIPLFSFFIFSTL